MTYRPSKRMMAARRKKERQKVMAIKIAVAAFFIAANIVLAAIFWPMLKQHHEDIKAGKKQPVIEIKLNTTK